MGGRESYLLKDNWEGTLEWLQGHVILELDLRRITSTVSDLRLNLARIFLMWL